jgi:AIR synthase-related protein
MSALTDALRSARGLAHKTDLKRLLPAFQDGTHIAIGDDCAAIPDGDGYLLFAIEGFVEDFVASDPYFAGYCGIMVNASDVYAMGGRPIAVVDAVWSCGDKTAGPALKGLADAAAAYGIPVVGGHSNLRAAGGQLAVAIIGRAKNLLTSFHARPGDCLVAAIDLRGGLRDGKPYWDASTGKAPEDLRAALETLPWLAEQGLCRAAKDISMAGLVGTALMLAEASGIGMTLRLADIPCPSGLAPATWLTVFPSYGFLLAVDPAALGPVLSAFASAGIAAAHIGRCDDTRRVVVEEADGPELFWDLGQDIFMGVERHHA